MGTPRNPMENIKRFMSHLLSMNDANKYMPFHRRMARLLAAYGTLMSVANFEDAGQDEMDILTFFEAISFHPMRSEMEVRAAQFYCDMGFRHDDTETMRRVLSVWAFHFSDMIHPTDAELNVWIEANVSHLFANRPFMKHWKDLMRLPQEQQVEPKEPQVEPKEPQVEPQVEPQEPKNTYWSWENWSPSEHRSRSGEAIESLTMAVKKAADQKIVAKPSISEPGEARFLLENLSRILAFYGETCKAIHPTESSIIAWNAFLFPYMQNCMEQRKTKMYYWMGLRGESTKRNFICAAALIFNGTVLQSDDAMNQWVYEYGVDIFVDYELSTWRDALFCR